MNIFSSFNDATAPPVAVEFAANRVAAASIDVRGGRQAVIASGARGALASWCPIWSRRSR